MICDLLSLFVSPNLLGLVDAVLNSLSPSLPDRATRLLDSGYRGGRVLPKLLDQCVTHVPGSYPRFLARRSCRQRLGDLAGPPWAAGKEGEDLAGSRLAHSCNFWSFLAASGAYRNFPRTRWVCKALPVARRRRRTFVGGCRQGVRDDGGPLEATGKALKTSRVLH